MRKYICYVNRRILQFAAAREGFDYKSNSVLGCPGCGGNSIATVAVIMHHFHRLTLISQGFTLDTHRITMGS